MDIADKLSRFQPVEWLEKVRYMDISPECDKLFDALWEAPRNHNHSDDISVRLRILYGLELDNAKEKTYSPSPLEHNILRTQFSGQ